MARVGQPTKSTKDTTSGGITFGTQEQTRARASLTSTLIGGERFPSRKPVLFGDLARLITRWFQRVDDVLGEHADAINENDRVLITESGAVAAASTELRGTLEFVILGSGAAPDELWLHHHDGAGAATRTKIV